ncbi:MAG TPA: HlyD family secretion protein [Novosphingobium sp.]|nr:HlyD family secretion protein [Novosphingobium sp.]
MPQSDVPAENASDSAEENGGRIRPGLRKVLLGAGSVLAVAGICGFAYYEIYGRYQQSTEDAYVQADGVTVSPKVAGYVEKVFVVDNQAVKAGDPLVQIDPRDYRAQTAQYAAQIDAAKASATGAEAQIRQQQAAIDKAAADLAVARDQAAYAADQVGRYAPLAATGAETREHLASLKNDAAQARGRADAAAAALASARQAIGSLKAQLAQANAQGEGAQAQLDAANVNLSSTLIRAATDGRVGDKGVRQGQFVQPATRLMTVVPVNQIYITANFKETQMGLMRPGQPVHVRVDALPGVDILGKVDSVSPGTGAQFSVLPPQNATGNFTKIVQRVPVRVAIYAGPETRQLLVPGMSVEVTVDTRSARDANQRIREEQERHNRAAAQ